MIYRPSSPLLRVSSQNDFVHASADINCPVVLDAGIEGEEAEGVMQEIWDSGLHVEQNNWVLDVHETPLGVHFRYRPFDARNARAIPGAGHIAGLPEEYEPALDIFRELSDTFRAITDSKVHQIFCIPRCATSSHTHDHAVITRTFLHDFGTIVRKDNPGRANMLWIPVGELHESPIRTEDPRLVISATPVIA